MKENVYMMRDIEIEQDGDFMFIRRNDAAALRTWKQYKTNASDPEALILLHVGQWDRDQNEGVLNKTPRQVIELAAPGHTLTQDEIEQAKLKGILPNENPAQKEN